MSEYELETKLRRHILLVARHKLTSALKKIRRCQTHFLARLGLWHPLAILRAYGRPSASIVRAATGPPPIGAMSW